MTTKPVAKDRFEETAIAAIEAAEHSLRQVEEVYNDACTLCTLYGRTADCNACPIRESAIGMAKWHGTPAAYEWIQKEEVCS